ncbi:MAG: GNAT family N-acetyltransferase [Candidatus Nanopelagicales bacterium]|nr:GNAT family N-acetyltransferase [Candidatus Nanopelagicales bacterium]
MPTESTPMSTAVSDQAAEVDQSATVCRLHVRGAESLPIASAAVGEAAMVLGVSPADCAQLRCVTQELAAAVVANAFEPGDEVALDVLVQRQPGGVSVVLSDQGAPSYLTRTSAHPPRLAELIRLGFADELDFSSHGRAGNNAKLFKKLRYRDLRDDIDLDEPGGEGETPLDGSIPEIETRELRPSDTLEVARLFHRCYGYSAYWFEIVYEPERLAEFIAAGRHRGTVALVNGRIVGHMATTVDRPDSVVGLVGMLVVDPAYRKFKVAGQLTLAHAMRLIEQGFIGQYSSAVTVHTASQKIALKFGGHEVALLVADVQPNVEFKEIDGADASQGGLRSASVWFYNGVGKDIERRVFVPQVYRDITESLYANAELPRTLQPPIQRPPEDVPETSRLDLQLRHEAGIALIKPVEYGRDFVSALQHQLNQLCLNRFDVIRLILPMADPLTSYYGVGLQELGFFYCGVFPEIDNGDALVLQYLNNVEVDPRKFLLVSEFGHQLRDFVLADRAATERNLENRQRSRAHMTRIYEALQ